MADNIVHALQNISLHRSGRRRRRRRRPRELYILRGLPGSGKSVLARQIKNNYGQAEIFSTDDYFRDENGHYRFKASLLKRAHKWNQMRAREAMEDGESPIIIDNTNIHLWEMKPYVEMRARNQLEKRCFQITEVLYLKFTLLLIVHFLETLHICVFYKVTKYLHISFFNSRTKYKIPERTIQRMHDEFEEVYNIHDVLQSSRPYW